MKQRIAILGCLLLATASVGCSETESRGTINEAVVDVEIDLVRRMRGSEEIAYSGTIEASETVALSFATGGRVARVLVDEGDEVEKGQLLAELESESHHAAYKMARATLDQAEDALARLEPMYANGNLPEIKLVEVKTTVQRARAAAVIAKKNLDDCRLTAPADGVIGRRAVDPGMTVIPNVTSIDIVRIDRVQARVAVPEDEIATIERGEAARIRVRALGNDPFAGTVEEIGVVADPLAHSYTARIGIDNPERRILPGMLCHVTLDLVEENPGVWIPTGAVMLDENGDRFVFTVRDRKAVRTPIEIGRLLRRGIEITSGLNRGDIVVVAGQQKLTDGAAVRTVER